MQCVQLASGRRCAFPAHVAPQRPVLRVVPQPAPTVAFGIFGPQRKWRHIETNKNGNWVRRPMHVKTGDTVVVIAGDEKGKTGKISKVLRKYNMVMIDGVNMSTRHMAPTTAGEQGERVEKESPFHASNVMHWSEKEKVRSRIGHKMVEGKKVRFLKKTGEVLSN